MPTFLITYTCYGTRLHGSERGSVRPGENGWLAPAGNRAERTSANKRVCFFSPDAPFVCSARRPADASQSHAEDFSDKTLRSIMCRGANKTLKAAGKVAVNQGEVWEEVGERLRRRLVGRGSDG